MTPSLLITQCLQNDFVQRVGRYEPLPNLLHVGAEESRRLLGEDPKDGPLARVMRWAYALPDERLRIVHIRDWHDAADPAQASHLAQFGRHCLKDTPGAAFAFPEPGAQGKDIRLVDTLTLNDFTGTSLAATLEPFKGSRAKVGLLGVWTDAKISFLAYELRTRYPDLDLAVCSALCASSSRAQHFIALDQLQRLLGVKVFPSLGGFQAFLTGEAAPEPAVDATRPALDLEPGAKLAAADVTLLRYLFRDSVSARLRRLDGGFSGNVVMGSESVDAHGHAQAPCVVKIGPVELIGRERAAFERIESVLGNSAPRLADFADFGERGGLKYRYAAMGGGGSSTFQKRYAAGLSPAKTKRFLDEVFRDQLGRLYQAAAREKCSLLEYYQFDPAVAARVKPRIESVLGGKADKPVLSLPGGLKTPDPVGFYADELPRILPLAASGSATMAFIHGDLNGANIVIDGHDNVWLIDFFHTHRGHVLKDLIKLENDLLYIFTPLGSDAALREAAKITDALLAVADLAKPLPSASAIGLRRKELVRAWGTVRMLRSYYPSLLGFDRDPLQGWIGALRYAAHTLSFDESDARQKLWALYAMGRLGARVAERLGRTGPLRIDWLDTPVLKPGRLGLTILPGRRDYGRDLKADLAALKAAGVSHLACLLSPPEFHQYGVDGYLGEVRAAGLEVFHLPMLDGRAPSREDMRRLSAWLDGALGAGARAVVHCVGGLGRSGLAAACLLKSRGLTATGAVAEVRRARGARAVETRVQEDFVRGYRP
ncbi:MAG: isochorismatase family protein [Elusimicrobia bacterium]|nr:isochorismatase family protein [Elusimicrobiota bacterium]